MSDIVTFLRHFQKRPAMYLGNSTVTIDNLKCLITGIQIGRSGVDVPGSMDVFEQWVLWRHESTLCTNSYGHILEHAGGDQVRAFHLFFEYLDEYMAERERLGGAEGIKSAIRESYRYKAGQ